MRIDIYDLKSSVKERVFAESFDGTQGHQWSVEKGQEPASENGTTALSNTPQYPGHIFQLKDMQSLGHRLQWIGKETISGVTYQVLELTLSNGFTSYYYINDNTGLIDRTRSSRALHIDINPNEQLIEVQRLSHQSVKGIIKPFIVIEADIIHDTVLVENAISRYIFNPPVSDSLYLDLTKTF